MATRMMKAMRAAVEAPDEKGKPESPALTLLRFTYEHADTSRRRIGYALSSAVETAIEAGMRFGPDDLVTASKSRYEGGFCLSSYLNQDAGEVWYSKAVEANHATAMTAIERFLRRPRFVYQGEVIHLGRGHVEDGERAGSTRVRLHEAVTEDNPGGWVHASSFSDDGKFVNFMASNCRPSVMCHVCGQYSRKTEEAKAATVARRDAPKTRRRTYRMAMTVRELLELDGGENEVNVRWVIRRGLERVRATRES